MRLILNPHLKPGFKQMCVLIHGNVFDIMKERKCFQSIEQEICLQQGLELLIEAPCVTVA